jgi:hypothetical protein
METSASFEARSTPSPYPVGGFNNPTTKTQRREDSQRLIWLRRDRSGSPYWSQMHSPMGFIGPTRIKQQCIPPRNTPKGTLRYPRTGLDSSSLAHPITNLLR